MTLKRCPTCDRTYSDQTISFCLIDGSVLSAEYDPEATKVIQQFGGEPARRAADHSIPDTIPALPFLLQNDSATRPDLTKPLKTQPDQSTGNLMFGIVIAILIIIIIAVFVKFA